MAEFKNKEEYDKWKAQRLKNISEKEKEIKNAENYVSVQDEKGGSRQFKRISIISILFISLISLFGYMYYYYSYSYQPKKVVEDFLQATRLHDIEKICNLMTVCIDERILINLIDWKIINEKREPAKKVKLDLSEEAYKRDIEDALRLFKYNSFEDLIKSFNSYKSYEDWYAYKTILIEPLKEAGNYYYIKPYDIEYLIDITATDQLGIELKKKYVISLVRRGGKWDLDGKWKVTTFGERL